jgi:hypothetical protein
MITQPKGRMPEDFDAGDMARQRRIWAFFALVVLGASTNLKARLLGGIEHYSGR